MPATPIDALDKIQRGHIVTLTKGRDSHIDQFVTLAGDPVESSTTASIRWDDQSLTVQFDCEDDEIVATPRPRKDPDMWLDDCVEIYLDVNHTHDIASPWIHLLASAAGCICDERNRDLDYRMSNVNVDVEKTDTGWRCTMTIPWQDLGAAPKPGDVWGFNLNRCQYPQKELQCFSPTGAAFTAFDRWGHLVFADATGYADGYEAKLDAPHAFVAALIADQDEELRIEMDPFGRLETGRKDASLFWPPARIAAATRNAQHSQDAAAARDKLVKMAAPWASMSDDQLWDLMFSHTITRAWTVWTHGHCPTCKAKVVMYAWQADAINHPWKMRCPSCTELFPKNDFHAYYQTGLDQRGIFDPALADRSLLFNTEHPDPSDPLHHFGVDDGEGYVNDDGHRWRFIGAYLVYGHWNQLIVAGVCALWAAYAATGDRTYAHKAAILIDRIADLNPSFDFATQGLCYEKHGSPGYVTMWHNAVVELRNIVLAYDCIFDAIKDDDDLTTFLHAKARETGIENDKGTFKQVQKNIEAGLLADMMSNYPKLRSNYPQTAMTQSVIKAVLDWPRDRAEIVSHIEHVLGRMTRVDGLTGEKGLTGYSVTTLRSMAEFLTDFARLDPAILPELLNQVPKLSQTYRFHINTLCIGSYYPPIGDAGYFGHPGTGYQGMMFRRLKDVNSPLDALKPSMFTFFAMLEEATGDPAYIQTLYHANDDQVEGLPHDLWSSDPQQLQQRVAAIIETHGNDISLESVNYLEWRLAILRSGSGSSGRAVFLDCDTGGSHGHFDGLNIGLFAEGLDLLPELGYPPLQFGDHNSAKVNWYIASAGHNTVVVNGKAQQGHRLSRRYDDMRIATTQLWHVGGHCQVIRAAGSDMVDRRQYERTVALIDTSSEHSYVLDIFRVVGGQDHAKFTGSNLSTITTQGLDLSPASDYGFDTQMRHFRSQQHATSGWHADWALDDQNHARPDAKVHLRYTDLTLGAEAAICDAWVVKSSYNELDETWTPRIMSRRQGGQDEVLQSAFVAILEPHTGQPTVASTARLQVVDLQGRLYGDSHVALDIQLVDGRRDIVIAIDTDASDTPAAPGVICLPKFDLTFTGEFAWIRMGPKGDVQHIMMGNARQLKLVELDITLTSTGNVELHMHADHIQSSGSHANQCVTKIAGQSCRVIHEQSGA